MATPNVSSIVDFLKSRGFNPEQGERFPLFQQRKRIFEQLGLSAEQGEFRGTAQENLNLLTRLSQRERETGVSVSPENILDMTREAQPTIPTQIEPTPVPPPTAQDTTALQGLPVVPEGPDLAQQALQTIQRGATFPLRQEAQEAEKAGIRLAGQQNIEQTIKSFASRGLFFSGARKKEISNVEADTLARVLGVDRKFALLIASGLETAAQDIAKEAQKGRAEAISSLGALGFAINPVTNRIEPTLAARREVRAIETEERKVAEAAKPEVLSVAEAKSLGVPFGTTEQEAFGITPQEAEEIDFSDPLLVLYAQATGDISITKNKVRVLKAVSENVLAGRTIVPDDTPIPELTQDKITESSFAALLEGEFRQIKAQKTEGAIEELKVLFGIE